MTLTASLYEGEYAELALYHTKSHLRILLAYIAHAEGIGLRPAHYNFDLTYTRLRLETIELDTLQELLIAAKIKDAVYLLSVEATAHHGFPAWARRRKFHALIS